MALGFGSKALSPESPPVRGDDDVKDVRDVAVDGSEDHALQCPRREDRTT